MKLNGELEICQSGSHMWLGQQEKKGAKNGCKTKLLFILFILGKDIVLEL